MVYSTCIDVREDVQHYRTSSCGFCSLIILMKNNNNLCVDHDWANIKVKKTRLNTSLIVYMFSKVSEDLFEYFEVDQL